MYRTTAPLPGYEDRIPAGRLVYFHNHSAEGPPIVLMPANNSNNKWQFQSRGFLVHELSYLASLEPLKREGFYRLREHFHPNSQQVVNKNALVQLGYNPLAEPILFFPTRHEADNSLVFPKQGIKINQKIYQFLEPLDLRGPHIPDPPTLH
ncbi:MAG: hypothetical protein MJE77_42190 [Proteobacteria bacterium]|nr:hypothetical protein [Pseudomonadota bacterium]